MSEVMEAQWVEGAIDCDGEPRFFYHVGRRHRWADKSSAVVTRITVQEDLPGLHCNMRRACVWVDTTLIFEVPVHNSAGIGYTPLFKADLT